MKDYEKYPNGQFAADSLYNIFLQKEQQKVKIVLPFLQNQLTFLNHR